jgi:hypothetical protein
MGFGPMTGRGAGYCGGNPAPGFADPGARLGLGWGFRGGGRGWRHMYFATGVPGWARWGHPYARPTPEQELEALKYQADWLRGQLETINKRIEEIGKD